MNPAPLGHHQLLVFWLELLVLLLTARGLGGLLRRAGQPAVIGELAAGLLLGPSVLGKLAPGVSGWLFPADPLQSGLLMGVAWIGVFLLLVLTGFETDLALVRRLGRAVAWVGVGSLVVPFLFGLGVGFGMPATFVGSGHERSVFALFMATALSISALPVIAKILSELDLMRRNFGQMILAAGMANDVVGWILLGVIAGLAQSGRFDLGALALTLAGLGLFLLFAFTLGQRAVDALLRDARRRRAGALGALTVTMLVALACGALCQAIGVEAVLGAFVAGMLLARSKFQDSEVFGHLQAITLTLFAPLFFATAGLRVDLGLLMDPGVVAWALVVVAAASLSKFAGAYAGARLARMSARDGLALGAGLNARGALEIVIATVGLSLGVLNQASYTVVVLMAIATSMMAPPMLRAVARNWGGSDEERRRLEQERLLSGNVLVRPVRMLIPSHGGLNSMLAARILDLAWPEGVEATVFSAGSDVPKDDLARVLAVFRRRPFEHEHVAGKAALPAILEHAVLGYGVVGVGATDTKVEGRLVSPMVDDLLAASPIPLIIVRRGANEALDASATFRRILVPASGTTAGRAAQEVAYSLARRLDSELLIAHVVTGPTPSREIELVAGGGHAPAGRDGEDAVRSELAERVVEEARALAEAMGVRAETAIRAGVSAPEEILALARERRADLIVLAANLRQLSGRPFLGHGVEHLLERSEETVVVVTLPPGWSPASAAIAAHGAPRVPEA